MPKYRVCLEELVEYELFVDATNKDEAEQKAREQFAALGPIQRNRAVAAIPAREVTECREWSA
ncbi:hypothetical protein [Burkholderia anthina]|uniref:hypothetical protein n=1 Tax=Burkholderia anthina TaxID=179879 RepID=UPI0037BF6F39